MFYISNRKGFKKTHLQMKDYANNFRLIAEYGQMRGKLINEIQKTN